MSSTNQHRLPAYFTIPLSELEKTKAYQAYVDSEEYKAEQHQLNDSIPGASDPPATRRGPSFEGTSRSIAETLQLVQDEPPSEQGVWVSPGEIPAGGGTWDWLQHGYDDVWAAEMGYRHPAEVEMGRAAGAFGTVNDFSERAGPQTVWQMDNDLWSENPDGTPSPEGVGHWAFHLKQDSERARQVFAGLDRVPKPSEIWQMRVNHFADGGRPEENPAKDINLVWVKNEADPDMPRGRGAGMADPNSNLPHDPTNGGDHLHDQTGDPETANYHTRMINGRIFTIDRDCARVDTPQLHKSWVVTDGGEWRQWGRIHTVNWNQQKSVERINKWREQQLERYGWDLKRPEPRDVYTGEEEDFIMEFIKMSNGGKFMDVSTSVLAEAFNAQFPDRQRSSGLQAKYMRLKADYEKFGDLNPNRTRRSAKKGKSRAVSEEADEDDSEHETSESEPEE